MQSKGTQNKLENLKDLFRKAQIKNVEATEENDNYFKIIEYEKCIEIKQKEKIKNTIQNLLKK